MKTPTRANALTAAVVAALAFSAACTTESPRPADVVVADAATLEQGKRTFRFDTFGDETQWTDALRMHEVIASAVDPTTALSVGLKVDADALPAAVVKGIQDGSISLKSPATTVALIKLNAVVGIQGTVETIDGKDKLTRVGVTCALCHSTVDNSIMPGIGRRKVVVVRRLNDRTARRQLQQPRVRVERPAPIAARGAPVVGIVTVAIDGEVLALGQPDRHDAGKRVAKRRLRTCQHGERRTPGPAGKNHARRVR